MSANIWQQEAETLKVIESAFNQAPQDLKYLKKQSLANLYKYLAYKAMEGEPKSQNGLTAARFFLQAVKNDPSLLKAKVIGKVLFKISAMILLPPRLAQTAINKFKPLSNTTTLLGYISLDAV